MSEKQDKPQDPSSEKDDHYFEIAEGDLGAEDAMPEEFMNASETGEGDASDLVAQLEALQAERDALESKMLRIAADYQNFQRRAENNINDARKHQKMDMVKSLLGVLDHFDHALSVNPDGTSAKAVFDGVQIVRDEFLKTLEQFGVSRIEAKQGEPFDPNRHEALMRQPTEGVESDHVVAQLQPGYAMGETTLRAAKVTIAP